MSVLLVIKPLFLLSSLQRAVMIFQKMFSAYATAVCDYCYAYCCLMKFRFSFLPHSPFVAKLHVQGR